MAYGLFSLQFSRFSFALGGFCHFLPFNGFLCNFRSFPLLWAASAKNAEKVRILSMSLIKADGIWFIFPAHFICSFALDGFCQTAEKVAISILSMGFFAIFLFLLCVGALHLGQLLKKLQFRCLFPIAAKHHFYDFIALRGPNPVSFVHCQGFLRNLSMSLHTNRWHMAYFLCNFQGFPLLWAASAISFLSMGFSAIFSVFLCFGRLLPKMLKKL